MNTDWLGLAGKIAVVTGAAGGMGRAIATSFVEAGCAVALLDRELDALKSLERAVARRRRPGHRASSATPAARAASPMPRWPAPTGSAPPTSW